MTRREFLRAGSLLAAVAAGCAGPVRAPSAGSTSDGGSAFSPSVRRRAREVGAANRPGVVVLQPVDAATSGTAWVHDAGHLLTNAHVLDELGSDDLEAQTSDGTTFDVAVEHRTETPDLALLSAAAEPPAPLQAGDSTALEPGQPLVQVGHVRLGYWTISVGRFRRRVDGQSWLLTDLPTMPGNSGSPVLTLDGQVVGMTFGAVPKAGTGPSAAPTPGPTRVYATYPHRRVEFAGHLAIEAVERSVRRWTEPTDRTDTP